VSTGHDDDNQEGPRTTCLAGLAEVAECSFVVPQCLHVRILRSLQRRLFPGARQEALEPGQLCEKGLPEREHSAKER
jgi:hypothetical protein